MAQSYAAFRPRYPDAVLCTILQYLKNGGGQCDLAFDLGCGSGQATLELAKHFNHVIGSDVSSAQLTEVPTDNPKVSQCGFIDIEVYVRKIVWILSG